MGHPLLDEFCRSGLPRPEFFRRCQRVFREEVTPVYDEAITLRTENAELRDQLEKLKAKADKKRQDAVSA
jgi:regulator of replication initiation timing